MIVVRKRWMTYTYFHPSPGVRWRTTHLFSPARRRLPGMVRVAFPTMILDVREPEFTARWSDSTRTKISKAGRETWMIERGAEELPAVLELFQQTAVKRGLRGYAPVHFRAFPTWMCSSIRDEDGICSGHVWVMDPEARRAWLYVNASRPGMDSTERSRIGRAHYYLLAQDGEWLRDAGMDTLDLQGYEPDSDDPGLRGVYQWKAGTHGQPETLYHYYPAWFYGLRRLREIITR